MAGLKLNTATASPNAGVPTAASTPNKPIPPPPQPGPNFSPAQPASSQPPSSSTPSSSAAQPYTHPHPHPRPRPTQQPVQPPAHAQPPKSRNASITQQQSDPDAPPHSPITPPLQPLKSTTPIPPPTIPPNFASLGGRAPLTHNSHPATVPSAPPAQVPPLDPIDFEDNVDVIALRTAISILQMQKKRAEADIRQLRDVKKAAAADPMAFYKDLIEGRVGKGLPDTGQTDDDSSDSDSDQQASSGPGQEGQGKDVKMEDNAQGEISEAAAMGLKPSLMEGKGKAIAADNNSNNGASSSNVLPAAGAGPAPPWTAKFPEKQNIYRCPPINWSQYAVEGEALDKLHHEQQTRPTLGTPALLGANGTYEFTGLPNADDGKKAEGIAAPFDPFRDKLLTKPKGGIGGSRRGA